MEFRKCIKKSPWLPNGTGGRIIFGIAYQRAVGFDKEDVFKKMDAIANAVSDGWQAKRDE